jgi:hypothetical protein
MKSHRSPGSWKIAIGICWRRRMWTCRPIGWRPPPGTDGPGVRARRGRVGRGRGRDGRVGRGRGRDGRVGRGRGCDGRVPSPARPGRAASGQAWSKPRAVGLGVDWRRVGSGWAGSAGVGSAGVGSAGVGSGRAGPAGVGSAGVGSGWVGPAGVGSAGVGSAGVWSAGVGSGRVGLGRSVRVAQSGRVVSGPDSAVRVGRDRSDTAG